MAHSAVRGTRCEEAEEGGDSGWGVVPLSVDESAIRTTHPVDEGAPFAKLWVQFYRCQPPEEGREEATVSKDRGEVEVEED